MFWACNSSILSSKAVKTLAMAFCSGSGGSGVVIIRVPSAHTLAGSPTPARTLSTHPGGDKIIKFTASGTLTIS